jgi:hypothetical protein
MKHAQSIESIVIPRRKPSTLRLSRRTKTLSLAFPLSSANEEPVCNGDSTNDEHPMQCKTNVHLLPKQVPKPEMATHSFAGKYYMYW